MHLRKLIGPFFLLAGVVLVPWTIWLTFELPSDHASHDWRLLWGGFDLALALMMLGTAWAALRRSPWLEARAAATGALLLVDAWFDIVLETGGRRMIAIAEAVVVELPLAVICFWVARDAERAMVMASVPGSATSRADRKAPGRASPRRRTRGRLRPGGRSRGA